nr:glycosyltransferase [Candidatus Frankia alpina]
MRVDVVTAVHAEYAGYLPAAWDSLRRQRHPHWTGRVQIDGPAGEVIDTLAACGAAADGRVRIGAHGTQEGPGVARNIALGECTAPLVQNLDADDELEPDAIEPSAARSPRRLRGRPCPRFACGRHLAHLAVGRDGRAAGTRCAGRRVGVCPARSHPATGASGRGDVAPHSAPRRRGMGGAARRRGHRDPHRWLRPRHRNTA